MSKTSQRKQSMFNQGYQDYKKYHGLWMRWKKHPMIKIYRAGWHAAEREGK